VTGAGYSNPILNEFNKVYDMIINFKNFIARSLMGTKKQNFNLFTDSLNNVKLFDLNESTSSIPQVINMSTSVEEVINITQDAFKKLIHELISTTHELQERVNNEMKQKKLYEDEINELKYQNDKSTNSIKLPKISNTIEPIRFSKNELRNIEEKTNLTSPVIMQRRNSNDELENYRKKFEENKTRIIELEEIVTKLKQEIDLMMMMKNISTTNNDEDRMMFSNNLLNNKQNRNLSIDEPSIMFTKLDAERNAKSLKKAIIKGVVSEQEYQVKIFFYLKFQTSIEIILGCKETNGQLYKYT
jgi:hypothetical protein